MATLKVAGLFAGIGGIEKGLGEGFETTLFCEKDEVAAAVLRSRFPGVPIDPDIASLRSLPGETEIVTAGFPCTDLSQAGRTAGLAGEQSSLIEHVFRLIRQAKRKPTWLLIENVRNMLVLNKGHAMDYIVGELERLKFAWAYRLIDSRTFGLPQRRQRVILVASRTEDPRCVVFADEAGEPPTGWYRDDAFGFYWTEGLRGLGWAQDATPTLKGGSSVGIPSPPGIWIPDATEGHRLVSPSIQDAERLQGFPARWTEILVGNDRVRVGRRWKMVGNAVSVPVASWLGSRLTRPGLTDAADKVRLEKGRWPTAAWGSRHGRFRVNTSMWPVQERYQHLLDVIDPRRAVPLSLAAAFGFLSRLERSTLRVLEDFRLDVKRHVELLS